MTSSSSSSSKEIMLWTEVRPLRHKSISLCNAFHRLVNQRICLHTIPIIDIAVQYPIAPAWPVAWVLLPLACYARQRREHWSVGDTAAAVAPHYLATHMPSPTLTACVRSCKSYFKSISLCCSLVMTIGKVKAKVRAKKLFRRRLPTTTAFLTQTDI